VEFSLFLFPCIHREDVAQIFTPHINRMQLIKLEPSPNALKKWRATFGDGKKEKHVDFGSKNMDDYTITHDKEQRERYRKRHRRDLQTKDPMKPGYLSWYILWGDSTDLATNAAVYKRLFNL